MQHMEVMNLVNPSEATVQKQLVEQSELGPTTQLSNLSEWIDPSESTESYFPLLVQYHDRDEPEIVQHPDDLRLGVAFNVFKTNVVKS